MKGDFKKKRGKKRSREKVTKREDEVMRRKGNR